jgi:hypothetical protein
MPFEKAQDVFPMKVTPDWGKGALGALPGGYTSRASDIDRSAPSWLRQVTLTSVVGRSTIRASAPCLVISVAARSPGTSPSI